MQKILLALLAFCLFACQSQSKSFKSDKAQTNFSANSQQAEKIEGCDDQDESACTFETKEQQDSVNSTDSTDSTSSTEPGQEESKEPKAENETEDEQAKAAIDLKQISFAQFLKDMKEKKSGYYLFGFALCPWCKELYPILEEVIEEMEVQVEYILTRDENRELLYDDKQKEEAYRILKEAMPDNEEGEPTLYVPLLVYIKDGKLIAFHEGTLEGHDAKKESLSQAQKEELKNELIEFFKENS